jgi:hypothetical protein
MILSSLEHFCHSSLGEVTGAILANGVAYGIDGVVAGVAIGVLATVGLAIRASRDKDRSGGAALPFVAMFAVGYGVKYGSMVGVLYGIGKGVLGQVM